MAMKRIINKTSRTLIVAYGDRYDKFISLTRAGVTNPLPENHPIFMEPSLGGMVQKGAIAIVTETEYQQKVTAIKAEVKSKEEKKQSKKDKLVEHAKAVAAAEAHNRDVETRKKVKKILKENLKGDSTAEVLFKEPELEKVEVPKSDPIEETKETPDGLVSSQVIDVGDPEIAELAEKSKELDSILEPPKKKKKGRKKNKAAPAPIEEKEEDSSDEQSD